MYMHQTMTNPEENPIMNRCIVMTPSEMTISSSVCAICQSLKWIIMMEVTFISKYHRSYLIFLKSEIKTNDWLVQNSLSIYLSLSLSSYSNVLQQIIFYLSRRIHTKGTNYISG